MKKSVNELKQGDVVYINLNPTKGHEQQGKRPGSILGKRLPYLKNMVSVAPITSKRKSFPLHVPLTKNMKLTGEILLEHHRSIDIVSRGFDFVEEAPEEVIEECLAKINLIYK